MMKFWANFAKNGEPGESTNFVKWDPIVKDKELTSSYIILDRKENLKMNNDKKPLSRCQKNFTTMKG